MSGCESCRLTDEEIIRILYGGCHNAYQVMDVDGADVDQCRAIADAQHKKTLEVVAAKLRYGLEVVDTAWNPPEVQRVVKNIITMVESELREVQRWPRREW